MHKRTFQHSAALPVMIDLCERSICMLHRPNMRVVCRAGLEHKLLEMHHIMEVWGERDVGTDIVNTQSFQSS